MLSRSFNTYPIHSLVEVKIMASAYSHPVEKKPYPGIARGEQNSPRLEIVRNQTATPQVPSISREEAVRQAILRTG